MDRKFNVIFSYKHETIVISKDLKILPNVCLKSRTHCIKYIVDLRDIIPWKEYWRA